MKQQICIRPGCGRSVIAGRSKYGLCYKCTELLEFFTWALNNIKVKDANVTDSGLIIPK